MKHFTRPQHFIIIDYALLGVYVLVCLFSDSSSIWVFISRGVMTMLAVSVAVTLLILAIKPKRREVEPHEPHTS